MSKSEAELYRTEFTPSVNKEYFNTTGVQSIKNPQLNQYLSGSTLTHFSHQNRIAVNVQILKFLFLNQATNLITICFKTTYDQTSCIYGYLHCEYDGSKKNPELKYRYVCTGPTFRSQDGEYRNRMITWDQFTKVYGKYSDTFAQVEEMVVDNMNSGNLTFQTDFYYPTDCRYPERKLEDFINSQRLPIKLFMMCWIYDFYNIHNKIAENHIYPAYQYIFYQHEHLPLYESIRKTLSVVEYEKLLMHISGTVGSIEAPIMARTAPQCGQKLFPLTSIEAVKTDNILFNVWRELYITNMVSNLVLNLISPSFSFINNWFYVQSAHGGLFDNIAMHDKFAHSEIAEDITSQLKLVDKLNYNGENMRNGPISPKFLKLSRDVHKAIIYANSDIKLTNLAVCMTSEYVGRTLRDMPSIIKAEDKTVIRAWLPDLHAVFDDIHIFTKHMFEYIYAFYCMNTKLGIIHGDLHMNNATINRLYSFTRFDGVKLVENPHIVYLVGEQTYCFPHNGTFATLIDFSRAIIGDYSRIENEFSVNYIDIYFSDQAERVMQIISQYFPNLTEQHDARIAKLVKTNFPLLFKILTVVDTYVIMSNILAMFSIDDSITKGKVKIADGAKDILRELTGHSEKLFVDYIHAALDGSIASPDDIEWPNLTLMQHFSDYILTDEKQKKYPATGPEFNIVEIFNSNNEVKYEIEDYDTWGPILSFDPEYEFRKKHNLPVDEYNDWCKFKQVNEDQAMQDLTAQYAQKEQDILAYESWMLL